MEDEELHEFVCPECGELDHVDQENLDNPMIPADDLNECLFCRYQFAVSKEGIVLFLESEANLKQVENHNLAIPSVEEEMGLRARRKHPK